VKSKKAKVKRKGSALLVVLFIVMAITILSLGFLSRSDVELACGENMILKTQMDYLAESGLEHARGLIINPQEIASGYWTGAAEQQLVDGSNDYYDVNVVKDVNRECNYRITCDAYRRKNGEKIGQSSLTAELRLNPCIALWTGSNITLSSGVAVNGDIYCNGTLINLGTINGDVFASSLSGSISGQRKAVGDLSLSRPRVTVGDFTTRYTVETIGSGSLAGGTRLPISGAQVCYRNGNLVLEGGVQIDGMLVVNGNLTVQGNGNVVTAAKNLPAILVTGNVVVKNGGGLNVSGLMTVDGWMQIGTGISGMSILGGLFVAGGITEKTVDSSGNENTGTLYNGPTCRGSGGQIGGAFEFDGVNDYVQTVNDPNKLQLTGDYTLGVWIKADASQKSWAGIFSKCDPSGSTNHWTLQFDSSTPRKLVIYHPTGNWDTGIQINNLAGAWHNIRIVRSGSTMKSYLDSVEIRNNTWANNPGSGNGHLSIGVDRTATSNYVYKGLIDDIRIYNRAPAVGETYPSSGLVGHWQLDEGGSSISITAAPTKTAIVVWSAAGAQEKWGQAAGAFFKSIERK
jgi:cytoskeletal protein CcmA (bactofilin family)